MDPAWTKTHPEWIGIHPYRWSWGWLVVRRSESGFGFIQADRWWTRSGAERALKRLKRKDAQYVRDSQEAGTPHAVSWQYHLLRVRDHPGRN